MPPRTAFALLQRALPRVHRAFPALTRRPALRSALASVLAPVADALSARLGAPVELQVQLLPSAASGTAMLGSPSAFALVALDRVGAIAVLELEAGLAQALVDRLA